MMQAVAEATRPHGDQDGGEPELADGGRHRDVRRAAGCSPPKGDQFACVDGPEFDAHEVDFDLLIQRNRMYLRNESESLQRFLEHPEHELERVRQSCRLEQKHPEVRCEAQVIMNAHLPRRPCRTRNG